MLFLIDAGLTYTQIGILYAVREITVNLFEIPSGFIADTYGRKKSLAGSFLLYMISFAVFYSSTNFILFLIAFVFYGIGDSFRTGTHKGMIMDYLKHKGWGEYKIAYYGNTRSWSQRGSALSSVVAALIVFVASSYRSVFLYSIIPYILNFLLILTYPDEIDLSKSGGAKVKKTISGSLRNFWSTIKKRNVLKIISSSAIHSAYLGAVKDYIQPIMLALAATLPLAVSFNEKQNSGIIIGVIYFFIYLLNSVASSSASKIEKKRNNVTLVTMLMGFAAGVAVGVFYSLGLYVPAILSFIVIYLMENVRKPVLTGYISDNVDNDILVSVISAQSQLKTIMTSIIAFVFGVFADAFGIGVSLIITSSILLIVSWGVGRSKSLKS